jgi:hypothetical protein
MLKKLMFCVAVAAVMTSVPAVAQQAEKTLKAGDSYTNPAAVPHIAKAGPQGVKLIATFVVEKDKPLATATP